MEGSSTIIPMKRRLTAEESITTDHAKIRVVDDSDTEDRISNLPEDLVHCILKYLPLYDVARTSTLSKKWRTIWQMHPQLVFDRSFFKRLFSSTTGGMKAWQSLFSRAFRMILSAHTGPILNLNLYLSCIFHNCPINMWLKQLLNKGIREIQLDYSVIDVKVPFSLFFCKGLTNLRLTNWILCPPRKYRSFNHLLHVTLDKISITADMSFGSQLQELQLKSCSGVEHLACQFTNSNNLHRLVIASSTVVDWRWFECTTKLKFMSLKLTPENSNTKGIVRLVELLSHIPSFTSLSLTGPSLEVLVPPFSTLMIQRTEAANLEKLMVHNLKLHNWRQIEHTLYMLTSFTNLQDLQLVLENEGKSPSPSPTELTIESYLGSLDWEHVFLDKLQTVKITGMVGSRSELHLIKLLLATSPALKRMSLVCSINNTQEKLKIKKQMQQLPRLSSEAQVICS